MSGDLDFEPIRGLPSYLPPGERLLWQGEPDFRAMAIRVFHVRKIAIYFALLAAWRMAITCTDGGSLAAGTVSALPILGLGIAAGAILTLIAFLVCRTTVYSITSRRVVMRIGVALPITFNLPFAVLGSGALQVNPDGTGTIPLALNGSNKLSYVVLWPHARPWRVTRAEPALRMVPNAARVAQILAQAAAAASPDTVQTTLPAAAQAKPGEAAWPLSPATA